MYFSVFFFIFFLKKIVDYLKIYKFAPSRKWPSVLILKKRNARFLKKGKKVAGQTIPERKKNYRENYIYC